MCVYIYIYIYIYPSSVVCVRTVSSRECKVESLRARGSINNVKENHKQIRYVRDIKLLITQRPYTRLPAYLSTRLPVCMWHVCPCVRLHEQMDVATADAAMMPTRIYIYIYIYREREI